MITNQEYEKMILTIRAKRYQLEALIKEAELFILENLLDDSKEAELALASKKAQEYQQLDTEYKEMLFDIHYRYNSQFIKPVPSKPAM